MIIGGMFIRTDSIQAIAYKNNGHIEVTVAHQAGSSVWAIQADRAEFDRVIQILNTQGI